MDSSQLNDQMDVEENDDTGNETPEANAKQTEQKDDGLPAPSEKRCKQREMSDLERLLIDQNKERHEKEMMLLDIKVQNELLKSDILKKMKSERDIIVHDSDNNTYTDFCSSFFCFHCYLSYGL